MVTEIRLDIELFVMKILGLEWRRKGYRVIKFKRGDWYSAIPWKSIIEAAPSIIDTAMNYDI